MNVENLCNGYLQSSINDVDKENAFFNEAYIFQVSLLKKAIQAQYKLLEIKETQKKSPTLDRTFVQYDKDITINTNTLYIIIKKQITESSIFVDADYIDSVCSNKYQFYDKISSFLNQKTTISKDDSISSLVSEPYFNTTYLNKNNCIISNSSLKSTAITENIPPNKLIGLLDCKNYIIQIDDIIDISSYSIKNNLNTFFCSETFFLVDGLLLNETQIEAIYLKESNYYLNNETTFNMYITKTNNYLSDNTIINDSLYKNINTKKVIDVYSDFNNKKAKKQWKVPTLTKTDSNKTNIVKIITDAVEKGTNIENNEVISYEELIAIMNNITDKLIAITGTCDE